MIIGINGYAGSGKDTVGKLIQELQPEMNWQIRKFAGKLKDIAKNLTGIPIEKFEDQEFKKTNLGSEWDVPSKYRDRTPPKPMTVRDLLQKLGTDAMRNGLHDNVWVNALMVEYNRPVDLRTYQYAKGYTNDRKRKKGDILKVSDILNYKKEVRLPNWIITDVRFENEAEAIKNKNGILVRVERFGIKPINSHLSETALDSYKFDHVLINNSSIDDLKETINKELNEFILS